MYKYEKDMFEVATLNHRSYKKNRIIYLALIICVFVVTYFTGIQMYTWIIILIAFSIMWFIERSIKNAKTLHIERLKNQFIDIFYPVFLAEHTLHQKAQIKIHKSIHDKVIKTIHSNLNLHTWLTLYQEDVKCFLSEFKINDNLQQRMTIILPYQDDVELEIRSFQRVSTTYPIKVSGSGYTLYTNDKQTIDFYKNMFERIWVYKKMDQLDIMLKNDTLYIAFKLVGIGKPLDFQTKNEVLLNHKNFIHSYLDAIDHILNIIKEPSHAYRK